MQRQQLQLKVVPKCRKLKNHESEKAVKCFVATIVNWLVQKY